jgi:hypothetical protein
VGIHIARDLARLEVRGDLTTSGGIALSVDPGRRIRRATLGGRDALVQLR